MTLPARPVPSFLPATPRVGDPRSRIGQAPLRPRDAAQVARTATRLFLGEGSIEVRLAAEDGGPLQSVLADIRRDYRLGRLRCDRSLDPEAEHAALELELGVKALMRLSDCLSALFPRHDAARDGVHDDDVARHAALTECAAAIADEALVCRDERAVKAGAAPVQRCLTISGGAGGKIRLHKFSRWQRPSDRQSTTEPDRPQPAADAGGSDGAATHTTEMDACLAFRIQPWRRIGCRRHGDPRRVLLRCRIRPVRVGDARRMDARERRAAGDWRSALLVLLIRLFRLPMRCRGEIAGSAQLKVYPMPRDGRAAVVVRVSGEGKRREGYRAAIHGVEAVRRELEGRRGLLPALAPEPAWRDDDGVRCY